MFIRTRYHGPTNARGSRISATTISGQRVYVPYDHALSTEENHDTAARKAAALTTWDLPRVWRGVWSDSGDRCYMAFGTVRGGATEYFDADFTDNGGGDWME